MASRPTPASPLGAASRQPSAKNVFDRQPLVIPLRAEDRVPPWYRRRSRLLLLFLLVVTVVGAAALFVPSGASPRRALSSLLEH